MKFSTAAAVAILAGSAVAAPGLTPRQARAAKRAAARTHGNPAKFIQDSSAITNSTHATSGNWAGAVLIGNGFTSVTGSFVVPSPSSEGLGTAWVGLDGYTCLSAILQTGVDWENDGGSLSYDAWYEWYPDVSYDFDNIDISAGDTIKVTVTASSTTSGVAILENVTRGQTVSHTFRSDVEGDLCDYNAEWIVEDFTEGQNLVPFADFGKVTFTGASAVQSGRTVGVQGATTINLKQYGEILTECSLVGGSGVSCTYL